MQKSLNLSKLANERSDELGHTLTQSLNRELADTIDLRSHVRQAYFSVQGPYRKELSLMLDGLARDLRQFADLIAQRIVSMGGHPVATVRHVAEESSLRDYPQGAVDSGDHLRALLSSYSQYELDTMKNMKSAQEIGEPETADLMRVISLAVENDLWFLDAYLVYTAIGQVGRDLPIWISAFENRAGANSQDLPVAGPVAHRSV